MHIAKYLKIEIFSFLSILKWKLKPNNLTNKKKQEKNMELACKVFVRLWLREGWNLPK